MKFGIIGTGTITEKFISNALLNPGFQADALLSRSRERGEAFARRMNISKVYTNLEDMASDDAIEAVYIASPNCAHRKQSVCMSRAHKHVFCEKAVASNSQDLGAMIKAAEENDRVFLEAMRPAHNPNLPVLRRQIAKLGTPRNALLSVCKYSSKFDAYKSGDAPNAFNPDLSNGAVMDMGSYATFMLIALFGEPERIFCTDIKLDNGFDGFGAYLAVYPNMAAQVLYSKVSRAQAGSEIQFDDASIMIPNLPGIAGIEIHHRDGRIERLADSQIPDYTSETAMFLRCCETPELARPYQEQSRAVMRILDEIRHQNGIVFPADLK